MTIHLVDSAPDEDSFLAVADYVATLMNADQVFHCSMLLEYQQSVTGRRARRYHLNHSALRPMYIQYASGAVAQASIIRLIFSSDRSAAGVKKAP